MQVETYLVKRCHPCATFQGSCQNMENGAAECRKRLVSANQFETAAIEEPLEEPQLLEREESSRAGRKDFPAHGHGFLSRK